MRAFAMPCGLVLVLLVISQVAFKAATADSDTSLPHSDYMATGYVPSRGLKAATVSIGYRGTGTYTITVPTRIADASPLFTQALALLKSGSGGTLTIGAGTFILGKPFVVTASKSLIKGQGMGKTILKLKNKADKFTSAGFLRAQKVTDVTVQDITFDGNKANQVNGDDKVAYGRYCIFMSEYKNWKFQRVECQNWQRYGFDPHGVKKSTNPKSPSNVWSFGLTIVDCVSHDNNWDGFTLDQTIGVYVANCTAYNNGRYGYNVVTASENVVLEKNVARNNGFGAKLPEWLNDGGDGCGYVADTNKPGFNTKNVTFRNNLAEKSFRAGFCVKDSGDIKILNNVIVDAKACANWKRLGAGVVFSGNTCSKFQTQFSISGGLGKAPTVTGNTFNQAGR